MFRNRSASAHQFAMVPRADVPRASFKLESGLKTTFDAGYLVPVYCEEVLPGDTFNLNMTAFCRLATPLFPLMDNLYLDSFFFFVPNRLVWSNWVRFMGEQDNPGDSISYTVPKLSAAGGYAVGSLFDYFGLAITGQPTGTWTHSVLPLRGYNLVWNEWFRDQNLQNEAVVRLTDGGDLAADFVLRRRGKRHDYFTSCLPWPQKGGVSVSIPLGTSAPVRTAQLGNVVTGVQYAMKVNRADSGALPSSGYTMTTDAAGSVARGLASSGGVGEGVYPSNLYADLSTATAATINQLRQSFQIQRLLERDARGGTRYTEIVRSHFGVVSPDARLQRPEYLGGGSTPIIVNPVSQTSASGLTGGGTPLGTLAGVGQAVANRHGFSASFVEHGYVLGLVCVRADLTYQQGLRRHWSRSTRYDFYMPVFAGLGEQAVLNKEIYLQGQAADDYVFGYQERWSEYRYAPSQLTGKMRSAVAGTLDAWHLAQSFSSLPTLSSSFIEENPPLSRALAVGAGANGAQLIMDAFFDCRAARPLPLYSVPGMIDHF